MKHRNGHLLLGYWSRVRGDRRAPTRADIDPAQIKRVLPFVMMLEHRAGGPVVRLAGTGLCDLFGQELRGAGLATLWDGQSRDALVLAIENIVAGAVPAVVTGLAETHGGRIIECEMLLLPLLAADGRVQRLLGCFHVLEPLEAWSDLPLRRLRLATAENVDEPAPAQAADMMPLASTPRAGRRAPHLRLVVSN